VAPIALLLFIHGFSEHIERYNHVFSHFAEQGIKTFSWDQRGFGRSAPKKSDWGVTGGTDKALDDIDHFLKQVIQEGQEKNLPVFVWGHSMVDLVYSLLTYPGWGISIDVRSQRTSKR
jgi:acylglycerol lipase